MRLLAACALVAAFAIAIPSAIAVHNEGLFELDGNAAASATPGDDWSTIFNKASANALAQVFIQDPFDSNADTILFGGNTKDDLALTGWQCNLSGVQDKDDIVNAFAAAYKQTSGANNGDTFVYFGADKFDVDGDAQIAFWIFLNPVGCNSTGSAASFTGSHTVGDVLIVSDFTNGGSVSTITVYRWDPANADTNGTLDLLDEFTDCAVSVANDDACARVNGATPEMPPWPYTDKDGDHDYQEGAFYEGGINLSNLLPTGTTIPCNATFLAETRSSQSVDSALQDYALGAFNLCPNLKLEKTPDTGSFFVGDQFNWKLHVTNSGAAATAVTVTDTIPASLQIIGTPSFDKNPGSGADGTCGVVGQVVTCNVGALGGNDGNTTAPEDDTVDVTIKVKALATAIPPGTDAACANVNNSGSVSDPGEAANSLTDNTDTGTVTVCRLATTKTAATALTRTYNWTVDKTATPTAKSMFDGDTQAVDWPIVVTNTGSTDSAWAVSGSITITNPAATTATINTVADVITGPVNATVDCNGATAGNGLPATVPAKSGAVNGTLVCTYSASLPDATTQTNTATATQQNFDYSSGSPVAAGTTDYSGTASVSFAAPTVNEINKTVTLKDSLDGAGETTVGADITAPTAPVNRMINSSYTCPAGGGTHTNVANLYRSGTSTLLDTDDATTVITCYQLTVTKTADTALTKTHHWSVTKDVTPTSKSMFDGDSQTVDWSIDVTYDGSTNSGFGVTGNITIQNPAPVAATINDVTDSMTGGVTGTVDCNGATAGNGLPATIAASSSLVCTYTATPPDGTTRTNTATATQQNYNYASNGTPTNAGTTNYSGTASVDFSNATATEVNKDVTLKDSLEGGAESTLGTTSAPNDLLDVGFSTKYTCPASSGSHTNVANLYSGATLLDTDDATTTITCFQLAVSKDASTSFTRTWTWTVDKVATGSDGTLELALGETFIQPYGVTYNASKVDSAFAAAGTITISNPAPLAATVNTVADVISPAINATVDCNGATAGDGLPATVPAKSGAVNGTLSCTYTASLPDATTRTNTATATQQNFDYASDGSSGAAGTTAYSGNAAVSFAAATITEIDESITATDNVDLTKVCTGANLPLAGCHAPSDAGYPPSATVLASQVPKTFTYDRIIGPFGSDACGDHDIDNTASFETNDTKTTDSDSVKIVVTVPCPTGCTLTQGYWKTHSIRGPAPFDDNWTNIPTPPYAPDDGNALTEDENSIFFLSGQTWYQVFWTAPKGNAYYNLAHQYMAAVLNILNGADPSAVTATLNTALTLFQTYTPAQIGALKGNNALRNQFINLAGILGSYNEGTIGPGHCDEDATAKTAF